METVNQVKEPVEQEEEEEARAGRLSHRRAKIGIPSLPLPSPPRSGQPLTLPCFFVFLFSSQLASKGSFRAVKEPLTFLRLLEWVSRTAWPKVEKSREARCVCV